eukprot:3536118-Pyramimonas_sp.AAC.1
MAEANLARRHGRGKVGSAGRPRVRSGLSPYRRGPRVVATGAPKNEKRRHPTLGRAAGRGCKNLL